MPALRPWDDMVAMHTLHTHSVPQMGTPAPLTFISGPHGTPVEQANAQMAFVTVQQIQVDALLAGRVLVGHEVDDTRIQQIRVKVTQPPIPDIILTPRQALHLPTMVGEHGLHPVDDRRETTPQRLRGRITLVVASDTDLPVDALVITLDNPSSAEAMAAAERKLTRRTDRQNRLFGTQLTRLARMAVCLRNGLADSQSETVRLAKRELGELWWQLQTLTPQQQRDVLLDLIPALVRKYGDIGGTVAAEWYERMYDEAHGMLETGRFPAA
jgi:hypothetical protein